MGIGNYYHTSLWTAFIYCAKIFYKRQEKSSKNFYCNYILVNYFIFILYYYWPLLCDGWQDVFE